MLASAQGCGVGVDVMDVRSPRQSLAEYFRLMRRQFTKAEWMHIEQQPSDDKQLVELAYQLTGTTITCSKCK